MSKVLITIPRWHKKFYSDGAKSGLFYVEAFHPFEVFTKAGFEVDIASEDGTFGFDEHSITDENLGDAKDVFDNPKHPFNVALNKHLKVAANCNSNDYAIAYAAAGHGALYYPADNMLRSLFMEIYDAGGVVAAVCHGPAIFEDLIDPDSKDIFLRGKTITGFTDIGEEQLGVDKDMHSLGLKTIKTIVEMDGGKYIEPRDPWDDFTHVDGRLCTGVNPQSAASLAKVAIKVSKSSK